MLFLYNKFTSLCILETSRKKEGHFNNIFSCVFSVGCNIKIYRNNTFNNLIIYVFVFIERSYFIHAMGFM